MKKVMTATNCVQISLVSGVVPPPPGTAKRQFCVTSGMKKLMMEDKK